ncbi:MAG TPA: STAS domain-containing protein [Verrucomicrobiae bacterium]|nr:STAS domain-containing protein [Verrucomicrobiae bacterium]
METVVGVFGARDPAEEAVKELLKQGIPQESIVFLTRSESEALSLGKELGTYAGGFVGGAAGLTGGVVAATLLLIPGIGQVFALGVGATAIAGLIGARAGAAFGKASAQPSGTPAPTPEHESTEDVESFEKMLKEGRSLVVVRTEFRDVAKTASSILDRLGLGTKERAASAPHTAGRMQASVREAAGVSILEIRGRITVDEGNLMIRELVQNQVAKGGKNMVLHLGGVDYIDSAGIGELVRTFSRLRREGGQMKLASVSPRVMEMLKATGLLSVFDIQKDEDSAVRSFGGHSASGKL